jgi:hypothetical protein
MKLAKDSKVVKMKFASRRVHQTLRAAMHKANEQKWTKVIIIGQGPDNGAWRHSPMEDLVALGMIEKTKNSILNEE